jgi:hypothetical protein
MPGIRFEADLRKEFEQVLKGASLAVTNSAKDALAAAKYATPVDTGTLVNGWRLKLTEKKYAPKRYKQAPDYNIPSFRFSMRKDDAFFLYNNVHYASYVEEGINPVAPAWWVPDGAKMLEKAIKAFESNLSRRFAALK